MPSDGAQEEWKGLDDICQKNGWVIIEMPPDGHCLFNAVADQLNYLRIAPHQTYQTIRHAAATYMSTHPDEFLPFLPPEEIEGTEGDGVLSPEGYRRYCTEIANSALWGGQTEISALSKYFKVPIYVYQSDARELKIGDEDFGQKEPHPLRISYHKKMYGLGEHYNSIKMARAPSQDG